jgi:hypothetical protein
MWTPSAVNAVYPNSYGPIPAAQPMMETPTQTTPVSQTATTISTDHFTVQFTFPESADPGNTITISTTTTAKTSEQVDSLSIGVFAYVNRQLVQTTSAAVLTNKQVYSGNTWQTTLAMTVPPNANRSMMMGTVTEVWEETITYHNSYAYWPYQRYYYPPDRTGYAANNAYPYRYTMYYLDEPSYVTVQKSSQQTLPLTYVLATTPEYEQLSAQQKQLQQEYDSLLAKNSELSSKYESLRSDYDQLVSKYNQLGSEYNAASQELSNFRTYTYVLIVVTVALTAAVALLLFDRRHVSEPPKK